LYDLQHLPQIISSLILQTHQNWELILIHDGPSEKVKTYIPDDNRITYIETKERKGNYGHHLRQWALKEFELNDYVVVSNADNYYVPTFIEYMLKGFKKSHTAVATYCTETIHSYKAWQVLPAKMEKGFLDCGAVMIKSNIAKEIGWRDITDHSADWIYFQDIASKYSWRNFIPVRGCLFVHN
jgi:glycosyltransferase involved in cell wall biosynthesis